MVQYYKLTFFILIYVFCFTKLNAQENKINPNGYNKFYYQSGILSSEGYMVDGKPDGLWKTYYTTGIKKSEGKRKNFLLDSIWVFFDEKGDTLQKINYMYGQKNGYLYTYKPVKNSTNYLFAKELYLKDLRNGKSFYYYPGGQLKSYIKYENSRREGMSMEYNEQGICVEINYYRNDFLIDKEEINRTDNNRLKQGVWKEYYENEILRWECFYIDDKLDGYYKSYDAKGKLLKSERYLNGNLVVITDENSDKVEVKNTFYDNGKVKESGGFKNNKPVGIHRTFSEEGKVVNSTTYNETGLVLAEGVVDERGYKQGDWKDYFDNGVIKAQGKYKNNKRDGSWTFYYKSSKIEQKGQYKNGKIDGKWIWYYPSGNILREENFVNGKEDGILTEFLENGTIVTKGEYIEGEKNGNWYYASGQIIEEGGYKNGLRDGEWKQYFPGKILAFEGRFVQGDANGKHKFYYENGNLRLEASYEMGRKQNTWKWYDEQGIQVHSVTYENDIERKVDNNSIEEVK